MRQVAALAVGGLLALPVCADDPQCALAGVLHCPFPDLSQGRGSVEGHVELNFAVRPDGTVTDVRAVDSYPLGLWDDAVIATVEGWRYAPGELRLGETMRFEVSVTEEILPPETGPLLFALPADFDGPKYPFGPHMPTWHSGSSGTTVKLWALPIDAETREQITDHAEWAAGAMAAMLQVFSDDVRGFSRTDHEYTPLAGGVAARALWQGSQDDGQVIGAAYAMVVADHLVFILADSTDAQAAERIRELMHVIESAQRR